MILLYLKYLQFNIIIVRNKQWVYGFLDWSDKLAAGWYIGLFAGYAIIFFIIYGFHFIRDYVGKRFGRYKDDDSSDSPPV